MANNIAVTAGAGTTLKTTDDAGVHTPHHNIDRFPTAAAWTTETNGTLTGAAAATNVLAANASRKGIAFLNNSAGQARIRFGAAADATHGLPVAAGGYWEAPTHMMPSGAMSVYFAVTGEYWVAEN